MEKINKSKRGDQKHWNTVFNQTTKNINKHTKYVLVNEMGLMKLMHIVNQKNLNIILNSTAEKKEVTSENKNTSRKSNVIWERNWGTEKILQYNIKPKNNWNQGRENIIKSIL